MTYDDWKATDTSDQGEPPVCCPTCGAEDPDRCHCGDAPPCDWCEDEAREHCAVCGQDLCPACHARHEATCREAAAEERAMERDAGSISWFDEEEGQ